MNTKIYKLSIVLLCALMTSCSQVSNSDTTLSCKSSEINCYRFSYDTIDKFKSSVYEHSNEWGLLNPENALSAIYLDTLLTIENSGDAVKLIESNPKMIFSIGQHVESHNKPREWIFLSEQAFIRSWNSLKR
jgi:hypothetical protein